MRQERTVQATIFEVFAGHEIGCQLKAISQWLDRQRALVSLVAGDLRRHGLRETGRRGLPAEAVLRCALLKQHRQLSYEELAFHSLRDTTTSSGVVGRAAAMQSDLGNEITKPREKIGRPGREPTRRPRAWHSAAKAGSRREPTIRPDAAPVDPACRRAAAPTSGDGRHRRRLPARGPVCEGRGSRRLRPPSNSLPEAPSSSATTQQSALSAPTPTVVLEISLPGTPPRLIWGLDLPGYRGDAG